MFAALACLPFQGEEAHMAIMVFDKHDVANMMFDAGDLDYCLVMGCMEWRWTKEITRHELTYIVSAICSCCQSNKIHSYRGTDLAQFCGMVLPSSSLPSKNAFLCYCWTLIGWQALHLPADMHALPRVIYGCMAGTAANNFRLQTSHPQ